MESFKCCVCKKNIKRFPSRNRGKAIYCSKQCFGLVHRGESNSLYGIGQGIGHICSQETRYKISQANKGYHHTAEAKRKMSLARMGKKLPLATRVKMSATQKIVQNKPELRARKSEYQKGAKHWQWKGGVSGANHLARVSAKFREWREGVFRRDNWTCRICGVRGVYLHPHHIMRFAKYPKLRFTLINGLTLCVPCHKNLL